MNRAILFAIVLSSLGCNGQYVVGVEEAGEGARDRVLTVAKSQIGVTEKTGHNDGARIDAYLSTTGLEGTGSPYCGAFVRWVYNVAGLSDIGPKGGLAARAASWVSSPTWARAGGGRTPLPGDPWGLYWGGRIRHTGLTEVWGTKTVRTIEANTSPSAESGDQANGDGVWRKYRLINQIYAVRNWID